MVIAVIAILSSVLLIGTERIRNSNELTRNLANLRTLQIANLIYAADNNRFLAVSAWDAEGAGVHWHSNQTFREQYLQIPTTGDWPEALLSPRASLKNTHNRSIIERSYGYNMTGFSARVPFGSLDSERAISVHQLQQPAQTLAFADALDWQIQMNRANSYRGVEEYLQNGIAYRYDGKAGVVYYDGHTDVLSPEEVIGNRKLWELFSE